MKELLDKVISLRKSGTEEDVTRLVNHLDAQIEKGHTISIPVLESALKVYKDREAEVLTKDLLEWMQETDQITFETEELKVGIETYVSAKITDEESAFNWLEDNQYADLIKDTLNFPKGELTPDAEYQLKEMGLSFTKKSGIHPQTLKKVISDRLKAGEMVPDEADGINVHYFERCKVTEK